MTGLQTGNRFVPIMGFMRRLIKRPERVNAMFYDGIVGSYFSDRSKSPVEFRYDSEREEFSLLPSPKRSEDVV